MNRFCLDTSAYSNLVRGEASIVSLVDSADWLGIPAIVLGELFIGFLHGTRTRHNEQGLQEFLSNPIVEEIVIDAVIARTYAEFAIDLKRTGTTIPTNDIWVAACAARHGATVLTFDSHFHAIKRVGAIVLEAR